MITSSPSCCKLQQEKWVRATTGNTLITRRSQVRILPPLSLRRYCQDVPENDSKRLSLRTEPSVRDSTAFSLAPQTAATSDEVQPQAAVWSAHRLRGCPCRDSAGRVVTELRDASRARYLGGCVQIPFGRRAIVTPAEELPFPPRVLPDPHEHQSWTRTCELASPIYPCIPAERRRGSSSA